MTVRLVGIDAGGTKIHVAVDDSNGSTTDRIITDAGWSTASVAERAQIVADLIADLPETPAAVGLGAHGCDSDAQRDELAAAVHQRTSVPVAIVNDALLFGYAMGMPRAVDVVVGTGSIAVVQDFDDVTHYLGGWGWLVGDDGSAWGLVRRAVRSLTLADQPDPLEQALCARAGAADLRALVDRMQRLAPSEWAAWGDVVFDAGRPTSGSPAARAAIEHGLAHTVELVGQALRRHPAADGVVLGGGVALHQPEYADAMLAAVRERFSIPAVLLDRPPVRGALQLARALADASGRAQDDS